MTLQLPMKRGGTPGFVLLMTVVMRRSGQWWHLLQWDAEELGDRGRGETVERRAG